MITEKDLVLVVRLLDLYKLENKYKHILIPLKQYSVRAWYDTSIRLIYKETQDKIKRKIKQSKVFLKQKNKKQYLNAYK